MKILRVAVGNSKEAFIESRFTEGLNIISSDDNNKGKTIVIQSMMYAPVSYTHLRAHETGRNLVCRLLLEKKKKKKKN